MVNMSQGRKIDMSAEPIGVEAAILENDFQGARRAMAVRLARMFDNTDSARDVKALSITLGPAIDRCEEDFNAESEAEEETPLSRIVGMAEGA